MGGTLLVTFACGVAERGIMQCQRFIKIGVRHMVTRNGHLCHYTTAEGLISMITKREIWATDIFYLNDKSELAYGIDLATDELKSGWVPDAYRSGVPEAIDRLSGLKELRPHLTAHRVYVCSFSGKLDDVSQWRSYCPQGGYAVEFPPEILSATAHRQGFDLFACVYKEEAQRRLIRNHLKEAALHFGRARESSRQQAETLVGVLLALSAMMKHPRFEAEGEYRLLYVLPRLNNAKRRQATDEFRSRGSLIIPYQKMRLSERLLRHVKIHVGPCQYMEESAAAAGRLLRCSCRENFQKRVIRSEVPHRHL